MFNTRLKNQRKLYSVEVDQHFKLPNYDFNTYAQFIIIQKLEKGNVLQRSTLEKQRLLNLKFEALELYGVNAKLNFLLK